MGYQILFFKKVWAWSPPFYHFALFQLFLQLLSEFKVVCLITKHILFTQTLVCDLDDDKGYADVLVLADV